MLLIYIYKMDSNHIRLPDDYYKYQLSFNSNFNNQLLKGINSNLSLYDRDYDTKLYRPTNMKPLDAISFDKINENLDKYDKNYTKQDDIFHNSKSAISGAISGFNEKIENSVDNVKNDLKNLFNIDTSGLKIYGLLLFIFLFLKK
uniref:Uncharacterized protein n=1 Tax=viral metagenome TaxID=1070528 RepID=A0A6C0EE57_9ZZZZ